jgi:hypothetical protein
VDTATWKEVRQLAEADTQKNQLYSFAFSPDGRFLASAGAEERSGWEPRNYRDNYIRLWDLDTGKVVAKILASPLRAWVETQVYSLDFAPDGRTLASGGADGELRIHEVATGRLLAHWTDRWIPIHHIAFTPDGERIASAMADGTALVWQCVPPGWRQPKGPPTRADLTRLWNDLGGKADEKAYAAVYSLATHLDEAVAFLRDRLKPVAPVAPERLRGLIADLDSEDFERRQAASGELENLGNQVANELRQALATAESLEVRQRLERLLELLPEKWAVTNPDALRVVRGVWALQRIGTPEARRLLESLAAGAAGARVTREARDALAWLNRRAKLPRE